MKIAAFYNGLAGDYRMRWHQICVRSESRARIFIERLHKS